MNESVQKTDVSIIGGGFSGLACAYHLAKSAAKNTSRLSIAIVEKSGILGGGAAYSTRIPNQVLNVRAKLMGVDDNEPNDFYNWLKLNGHNLSEDSYAPRMLYFQYLNAKFSEVVDETGISLSLVKAEVENVIPTADGFAAELNTNEKILSRSIILAIGSPSFDPSFISSDKVLLNPWTKENYQHFEKVDSLALLGSGLTAVDAILSAEAGGFKGKYFLFSRHGLIPCPHLSKDFPISAEGVALIEMLTSKRSKLLYIFRSLRKAVKSGLIWQELIDGLRPYTNTMWTESSIGEKQCFMRHLKPYWEVHRHRVPLESWQLIQDLVAQGRLSVMVGQIIKVERADGEKIAVRYRARGSNNNHRIDVTLAFNCLGLSPNLKIAKSKLLTHLLQNEIVTSDELGIGLKVDPAGQAISTNTQPQQLIYVVGNLRKGEWFESTAVRELRIQAKAAAKSILNHLCIADHSSKD